MGGWKVEGRGLLQIRFGKKSRVKIIIKKWEQWLLDKRRDFLQLLCLWGFLWKMVFNVNIVIRCLLYYFRSKYIYGFFKVFGEDGFIQFWFIEVYDGFRIVLVVE